MKVIIVSDSHGCFGVLKKIVTLEQPFHQLIHLGDGLEDLQRLSRIVEFRFDGVNGNGDPPGMYPEDLSLNLGGRVCFFTHGHNYGVNQGVDQLVSAAKKHQARFAFFGHTHQASRKLISGIEIFNPGSICTYLSPNPTYIRWEIGRREPVFLQLQNDSSGQSRHIVF